MSANSGLYGRDISLQVVSTAGAQPLDLSEFRIVFHIEAQDSYYPGTAVIRIYNLNDRTVNAIVSEYQTVALQAGYINGPFGLIFLGQIRQFKKGKENATTTFLDLLCSDSDAFVNAAPINENLGKGWTQLQALITAVNAGNKTQGQIPGAVDYNGSQVSISSYSKNFFQTNGIDPHVRGKVLYGIVSNYLKSTAASLNVSWHIRHGVIQMVPFTGYLPGEAVELSTFSGVVGIPEVSNDGIHIKCLLNPSIVVGGTITLNNALVNQILQSLGNTSNIGTGVAYNAQRGEGIPQFFANVGRDGSRYKVVVVEYEGDTRGTPWYVNIVAILCDPSTQTVNNDPTGVLTYGAAAGAI